MRFAGWSKRTNGLGAADGAHAGAIGSSLGKHVATGALAYMLCIAYVHRAVDHLTRCAGYLQNRRNTKGSLVVSDAVWDERRLRIATDSAGVALWSWNVDTDRITMDKRAFDLWDLSHRDGITFEDLSARILPADLDRVREAFNATRAESGAYEIDFRILHGDDVRWVSARGRGDDEGIIGRIMFGVFLDVTVRKLAEEARELIAGEMQHRIKNMFSLMCALSAIASRSTGSKDAMEDDLKTRLLALSAAHDLINLSRDGDKRAVRLGNLLTALLKAYSGAGSHARNITIAAPEFLIGENAVSSVALIVHELATNSAKYGALSSAEGTLDLSCTDDAADLELIWTEKRGPAPAASVTQDGFGSMLTEQVVKQVKGSIARTWTGDGVIVTLRMNKALLAT